MSYRWRAHTTHSDIRSKLHGFAGDQPLLQTQQLRASRRRQPKPRRPARRRLAPGAARPTRDAEFPGAGPVARPRPPRAGARHRRRRRCTCPGRRSARSPPLLGPARFPGAPALPDPSGPQPPPARPTRRRRPRPRPDARGEEGGARAAEALGMGPCGRGGAHLSGRGSGGHLVSPQRRARLLGPETPRHQPAGSSRHSPDKHLPGASGAGGGGGRTGPAHGEGTQLGQKSGERPPAPPGSSPRGAPGRRLPASAATGSASRSSRGSATSAPPARPSAAPGASRRPRSAPAGSSEAGFHT